MTAVSPILNIKRAAAEAEVSEVTVRRWIIRYRIGIKIAGRFRVDGERLRQLLEGGDDAQR